MISTDMFFISAAFFAGVAFYNAEFLDEDDLYIGKMSNSPVGEIAKTFSVYASTLLALVLLPARIGGVILAYIFKSCSSTNIITFFAYAVLIITVALTAWGLIYIISEKVLSLKKFYSHKISAIFLAGFFVAMVAWTAIFYFAPAENVSESVNSTYTQEYEAPENTEAN